MQKELGQNRKASEDKMSVLDLHTKASKIVCQILLCKYFHSGYILIQPPTLPTSYSALSFQLLDSSPVNRFVHLISVQVKVHAAPVRHVALCQNPLMSSARQSQIVAGAQHAMAAHLNAHSQLPKRTRLVVMREHSYVSMGNALARSVWSGILQNVF